MKILARYAAVGVALLTIGASTAAEAKLKRLTIGSDRQGSVSFLLASAFAKEFELRLLLRATVRAYTDSTYYLPIVNRGAMTLGLNNSIVSGAAARGAPPFRRRLKNIRAIARVWTIPYGLMVKADSGIGSVADLKGKRVVTQTGSIVSLTNLNIAYLHSGGLSLSDVTAVKSDGILNDIEKVVEGGADACAVTLGMPAVHKANAAVPGGIRILPLGAGGTDSFIGREVPGARGLTENPGKRYPFVTGPTRVAAFDIYLDAGAQVSEEDAYKLVKVLHTQWESMQKSYGPLRPLNKDDIVPPTNSLPYHAGVVKYWKEVGLWTAENEKQQQEALAAAAR